MSKQIAGNIQHIVVLMFENRSFDHMLGAMPGVNGVLLNGKVNPDYYNTMKPTMLPNQHWNPPVAPTPIGLSGQTGLTHDFNHDFGDGMMPDLFGPGTTGYVNGAPIHAPATTYPATNSGFLSTIVYDVKGQPPNGPSVMYFFEQGSLKVFHQLASEFVTCDKWHCDMPGHTQPNRCFMHCATSGNMGIDETNTGMEESKTIFQQIEEQGYDWKMYNAGGWWLDSTFLAGIINNPNADVPIAQFYTDIQNKSLPFYSFLMPGLGADPDTSMHPAAIVQPGENYLAAVYNAIRNSNYYWGNTLLIVNFDENGGIYDHVLPPPAVLPDPFAPICYAKNNNGTEAAFDFSLLGLRTPTLLISPWLSTGIDSTLYQNTSILRYLQDLIAAPGDVLNLTQRDAKATSIAGVFSQFGVDQMRTDCPQHILGYTDYGGGDIFEPSAAKLSEEFLQQAPLPYVVSMAKEYLAGLPGHADSGKPFPENFATNAALNEYAYERITAAKKFVAERNLKI